MCKSQLSMISWNVEGLKSSLDDEDFFNLIHTGFLNSIHRWFKREEGL